LTQFRNWTAPALIQRDPISPDWAQQLAQQLGE
jgi:hypothetical protein